MLKKSYVNLRAEISLNYDLYHISKIFKVLTINILQYISYFYR